MAYAPIPGEDVCGDEHLLLWTGKGYLIAVVDGLGHGLEAAEAAQRALDTLRQNADAPVLTLIQRCHEHLYGTRGAAMSVATLDAGIGRLEWIGIGNVEARLLRAPSAGETADEVLLLRGGVVGYQLPALHTSKLELSPGDTLVMATDGIDPSFSDGLDRNLEPQTLADGLLASHRRETDDALVLVVRCGSALP